MLMALATAITASLWQEVPSFQFLPYPDLESIFYSRSPDLSKEQWHLETNIWMLNVVTVVNLLSLCSSCTHLHRLYDNTQNSFKHTSWKVSVMLNISKEGTGGSLQEKWALLGHGRTAVQVRRHRVDLCPYHAPRLWVLGTFVSLFCQNQCLQGFLPTAAKSFCRPHAAHPWPTGFSPPLCGHVCTCTHTHTHQWLPIGCYLPQSLPVR